MMYLESDELYRSVLTLSCEFECLTWTSLHSEPEPFKGCLATLWRNHLIA